MQNLTDLARVTDAVFQRHLVELKRLSGEETHIRDILSSLETAGNTNVSTDASHIEMRAIGADLRWEGWVMRQRMALNMRLANLLVQKEALRDEIRKSLGRSKVAEALSLAEQAKIRHLRNTQFK
jgi:acid stress-induced BolA-like protein IbaG/YrbA